ncbi:HNH endonuclease [Maribacter sp. X9]|uniref:HNH endonuclease n=1 Tax=Maribacter sp. X9 TaxID=3402159 RepID=UPI003AF3420D
MFNHQDIKWVRNVKRDKGKEWAYFDDDSEEMILNWSSNFKKRPTPAMLPEVGDIIVVYQKINITNEVHFTHLVTPIDNIERDCIKTNPSHRWGRKVKILSKTKQLFKPEEFNLTSVNQGHTYRISSIDDNAELESIQKIIWNLFKPYFKEGISKKYFFELTDILNDDLDDAESDEGKLKLALHLVRERSRKLVAQKKASVRNPKCECCTFDFANTYPYIGDGFIECHHRVPINRGERISKLEDLALVCANCHRMLHRKNKQNEYYTVEELKQIIINE